MSWLDDIQKDLEKSRNHPVRKKKDWEIEKLIRLSDVRAQGGKVGGKIAGQIAKETGQIYTIASKGGKKGAYSVHKLLRESGYYDSEKHRKDCSNGGKVGGKASKYWQRKLDYDTAEYIRNQYKRGNDVFGKKISQPRLAKMFGVSRSTIQAILEYRNYFKR